MEGCYALPWQLLEQGLVIPGLQVLFLGGLDVCKSAVLHQNFVKGAFIVLHGDQFPDFMGLGTSPRPETLKPEVIQETGFADEGNSYVIGPYFWKVHQQALQESRIFAVQS